jgi:D-glycero-D-manno-heptose 1,7-bisphosphate phosphatase
MSAPAVFLDRDGTLIRDADYLADPDRVELLPGVVDALELFREAGFRRVVVTNQSGIARGLYSESDYRAVAARLDEVLGAAGSGVELTLYCPHHPDFTGPCDCRKPSTGMHEEAAGELGLDLARSFYVGDKRTDVEVAEKLGGKGILVRTGYGRDTEAAGGLPEGVVVVDDLFAAARHVVSRPEFR